MSKIRLNPFNLLPVICLVQYYEKKRPIFLHWKDCFFWKFCVFQQSHRCYRIDLITSTVLDKIHFRPLQSVLWRLSHSIILGKMGQKLLSLWKKPFFEMFVYIDLLVLKNWTYLFHSNCQKTFWTLRSRSLNVFVLNYSRKIGEIFFSTGKNAFFSKNCVFNTFLVLRKWWYNFHFLCQIPVGSLQAVPWRFLHSIVREKRGQNLLSTGR